MISGVVLQENIANTMEAISIQVQLPLAVPEPKMSRFRTLPPL